MDRIPRARSFQSGDRRPAFPPPGGPITPSPLPIERQLPSGVIVPSQPLSGGQAAPAMASHKEEKIEAALRPVISPQVIRGYFWGIVVFFVIHFSYLLFLQTRHDISTNNMLRVITDVLVLIGALVGAVASFISAGRLYALRNQVNDGLIRRAWLAATLLGLSITSYAIGQAIWTVYEITLASIPFPASYDFFYVLMYPISWAGIALLIPRNNTLAGRSRLLLDAGTAVASMASISWFFILGPTIAGLSGAPIAKVVALAYPLGDLSLCVTAAILLFGPAGTSALSGTIGRLAIGYTLLPLTSFVYSSAQLAGVYHTGYLSDVGWPLGWLFIGWALLSYPNDLVRLANRRRAYDPPKKTTRLGTTGAALRAISPALVALATCSLLLFAVALRNTAPLIQVLFVCAVLFLLPIVRQALTLIDNLMLNERLQIALDHSQQAFKDSQRELLSTAVRAEHYEELRGDIENLQSVHAQLSRGDLSARAPVQGPLAPVAQSLNLLVERMGRWSQQMQQNQVLAHEATQIYQALERISEGELVSTLPAKPSTLPTGRALFAIARLQNRLHIRFRRLRETSETLNSRLNMLNTLAQRGQQTTNISASPQLQQTFEQIEKSVEYSHEVLNDLQAQTKGYEAAETKNQRLDINTGRL